VASQIYVGANPTTPEGVVTRLGAESQISDGPSRVYVDSEVIDRAALRATKVYVDDADNTFVEPSYYQGRDALNIPLTARGAPSVGELANKGVASLVSGKIPAEQIPGLGAGILRGPWPLESTVNGTVGNTPMKIGEFNIGQMAAG
jgi:hypothetical protein